MRITDGKAVHLDALDKLLVKTVNRVELVELVLDAYRRCRVANCAERVQITHCFQLAFRADGRLRLIDHNDGVRLAQEVDGTCPAELLVIVTIDEVELLLKSVNDDDHDLNVRIHGEIANLLDMVAVIDKIVVCHIMIKLPKMLLRDVERLLHALLDGVAWHNDNELREPIPLVQLQQRAQIHIGLARARLHLNIEMQLLLIQMLRQWQTMPRLNGTYIFEQILIVNMQTISHAFLIPVQILPFGKLLFQILRDREQCRFCHLPLKHVADGGDCLLLIRERGIKLQLHMRPS